MKEERKILWQIWKMGYLFSEFYCYITWIEYKSKDKKRISTLHCMAPLYNLTNHHQSLDKINILKLKNHLLQLIKHLHKAEQFEHEELGKLLP